MLNENIKAFRKSKGLSQEDLAVKLNVVRQTVSKWETGLSVPDADMLIVLAAALDTSVGALLGETVAEKPADDIKTLAEKLEIINLRLARRFNRRRMLWRWFFILAAAAICLVFAVLLVLKSPYLGWDYSDPELAAAGVIFHGFEWFFVRIAPLCLIGAGLGVFFTRKKA